MQRILRRALLQHANKRAALPRRWLSGSYFWYRTPQGPEFGWGTMMRAASAATAATVAALLAHETSCAGAADGQDELSGKPDMFGGILIEARTLPESVKAFDEQLGERLSQWKAAGKKGVWLKLKPEHATLLATAYAHGFEIHHANKQHIVLVKWLPETPSTIPQPASHYVGVGIAVIDKNNRILVVQEKFGPASRRGRDFWKMPTGLVDNGEDLETAAVREVFEETGVRVAFEGVLAFRQQHQTGVEQKTDLFFLCKARPLSSDITLQEAEIANAVWMPLSEYLSKPLWPEFSAYWWMSRLAAEAHVEAGGDLPGGRLGSRPTAFVPNLLPLGSRPGANYIYSAATCPPPQGDHAKARARWEQAQAELRAAQQKAPTSKL